MTAMPEAGLAREAGLAYAICAVVVNRAAGRLPPGGSIHADLREHVAQGMSQVAQVLAQFLAAA
jgi:purine nucleoside phosphorylase